MSVSETKVALVTGGNSGIGKQTAVGLLKKGYRVVITSRNPEAGAEALAEIKQLAGRDDATCERLDLSNFSSIHDCAEVMLSRHPKLQLLVNNAGLMLSERRETSEGFEMTFGVNHLGHFLLTSLLLDRLIECGPSRIVNLSSDAHKGAGKGLEWDDLQSNNGYSAMGVYCRSKLANIYFTRELVRRYADKGISSFAVHPGVVRTGFARNGDVKGFMGTMIGLFRPFMINEEKGARTSLHCATAPLSDLDNGGYYAKSRAAQATAIALDDDAALRLWEVSERLVADAESSRATRADGD
ncbi:MAG: SDR family oxidoreductase [Myxococcota bacterium]